MSTNPTIVVVLLLAIGEVARAGASVAVINDADPAPPQQTNGELWCEFLVSHGYACTLFPKEGPTSTLAPFHAIVDLSGDWTDPGGSLPEFLSKGKTVVVVGRAPFSLGIDSSSGVKAWIGADATDAGTDWLRTVSQDPILGPLPMGSHVTLCEIDTGCAGLYAVSQHPGAKILASFVVPAKEVPTIGIQRNVWEGGVAVYLTDRIHPWETAAEAMVGLNAVRARELTIPTMSTWGMITLCLCLACAGAWVLRHRSFSGTSHTRRRRPVRSCATQI